MVSFCKVWNRILSQLIEHTLVLTSLYFILMLAFVSKVSGQSSSRLEFSTSIGMDRDISHIFQQVSLEETNIEFVSHVTSRYPKHFMLKYYNSQDSWGHSFGIGALARSFHLHQPLIEDFVESRNFTQLTFLVGINYNKKVNRVLFWQLSADLIASYRQSDLTLLSGGQLRTFTIDGEIIWSRAFGVEVTVGTDKRKFIPMFLISGQLGLTPFKSKNKLIIGLSLYGQFFKHYSFGYNEHFINLSRYSIINQRGPNFSMWFPALKLGFEI